MLRLLLLARFPASHFGHPLAGIHAASAFGRATVAGSGIVVVVEVIVPDEFFADCDVAQGEEPDSALDLVNLAVGFTGMVEIRTEAFAIDYGFAIVQSIKVGPGSAVITTVGFFGSNTFAGILNDAGSLADRGVGVDPNGMNGRRTNHQGHALISHDAGILWRVKIWIERF
jgi:hypothetical protein